jgi:hypothetical protein
MPQLPGFAEDCAGLIDAKDGFSILRTLFLPYMNRSFKKEYPG